MIKKNGKCYVVVEMDSDFMAVGFETSLKQQGGVIVDHMGTVLPARQNDDVFAGQDEVNVTNHLGGVEAGSNVIQAGIVNGGVFGRRVQ